MVPEEIAVPPLVLRRWRAADAPAVLAAVERSLPELRRFMPWAMETPSLESVGAYLDIAWRPPESYGFGLLDAGGEVVGGFGLHGRRGPGILEIGYWVRSDRTGRGYATAAARALTDVSFESSPGVFRVEIRCDPANEASAAVAAKLGYTLHARVNVEIEAEAQTGVQQVWATTRVTWPLSAGRPAPPAARTRR
ncbi:MAG TPA: GNAT family N-acetyltransferase [Acidimicrobiales bacterium]|nr:GNAT family N-acetyltransferase [Acidimicrobiales bacterium]